MKTTIISESDIYPALLGLGLSYGMTSNVQPGKPMSLDQETKLLRIATRLAPKDGGHNKFLESIAVWIDINAPRFWWSEFDTYRVGITKQSNSTMHTLKKTKLTQDHFEYDITADYLVEVNKMIADGWLIDEIKNALPDGFLQRRIVCTNYKTLKHIIAQRHDHKLPQWKSFCEAIVEQIDYPEFLRCE